MTIRHNSVLIALSRYLLTLFSNWGMLLEILLDDVTEEYQLQQTNFAEVSEHLVVNNKKHLHLYGSDIYPKVFKKNQCYQVRLVTKT